MKDKVTLIWYVTGIYALISMLCGIYLPISGNEMEYSLIIFYIGLPIISGIGGYLHSREEYTWLLFGQYCSVVCFIAFALPVSVFDTVSEGVIVLSGISTLVGFAVGHQMLKTNKKV